MTMYENIDCSVDARYVFLTLAFSGTFIMTLLRTNLSIAIILMVKTIPSESLQVNTSESDACPGVVTANKNHSTGTIEWRSVQQGTALGCYYYGNIITCVLGPWVAKKFGVKLVVGISMVLSAIFTLLSPIAANYGFGAFVAVRTLVGFFLGPYFSTSVAAFPSWIAPEHHTMAFSIVSTGFCIGYFASLNICSLIAEYLGWEAVFYISGAISLVWCLLWFLLMYNSPVEHPRLSNSEKAYLTANIPRESQKIDLETHVPWFKILTSLPFLAIIVSRLGFEWTFSVSMVLLPVYLATILKMNIATVGISSGLPFLIGNVVVLLGSKVVDILRDHTKMSMTAIRKLVVLTALLGSAASVLMAAYTGCDNILATVCFVMLVQFFLLHAPGTGANVFDLSPQYCGILLGFSSFVAGTCGFIAPLVAGYILDKDNSLFGWRTFFWITAGINIFCAVFYLIFGSAEEQSWSKDGIQATVKKEEDENLAQTFEASPS